MSENFSPIDIRRLYMLMQPDTNGFMFGISPDLIFRPDINKPAGMTVFGKNIDSPVGPAAGPHTQMAQNILTAWLTGARYIELKTVQTLDELNVSKPCIDMQDEGYNVEWSQELKVFQAYEEYLKAWILLHLFSKRMGFDSPGTVYNMSVGYNMEGILKENVQWFFKKMNDCSAEKIKMIDELASIAPDVKDVAIPDCMSDSITLSTMHGCPPDEIEKIGLYLIREKKLHTYIKLNPTLLGPEMLRKILNEIHGFGVVVPDEAFGHDLKYPDALNIINSLQKAADENRVFFGLKLTNTLESENNRDVFTPNEKMMYMSGYALHPISINLANKLQKEFGGKLNISFSAGADAFNISDILSSGLYPVSVCSDILKPGGYGRLYQYIESIRTTMTDAKALCIEDIAKATAAQDNHQTALLANLEKYATAVLENKKYSKNFFRVPDIKTDRNLGLFDCIEAPCVCTCPTNQDIPEYLYQAAKGDYNAAMEVILRTNPFPAVCGMVCDHTCQLKCTRVNYEQPILIREVKRYIAENAEASLLPKPAAPNGLKAAVIGAGPSGLSCAYFLSMAGFSVHVYETKSIPGGMVADAIPAFRLKDDAIRSDIERIKQLGVKISYETAINKSAFMQLVENNDFVYVAIGAQLAKKAGLQGENLQGVLDPLKFLSDVRRGKAAFTGKNVIVIGGGNTAIDVARTVKRLLPDGGSVKIAYRRTVKEMPADYDEILGAMHDGIEIMELLAPEKIEGTDAVSGLLCSRMKLGEKDSSGRARPVKIEGSEFLLEADTIIPALGQDIEADFAELLGKPAQKEAYRTAMEKVFIGGDAMRGAATIIKAIADGRKAAETILKDASASLPGLVARKSKDLSYNELMLKRSKRQLRNELSEVPLQKDDKFRLIMETLPEAEIRAEGNRCLYCDELCNICVTVCPNRANRSYKTSHISFEMKKAEKQADGSVKIKEDRPFVITQEYQILNVADFCNECGNCTTFCPTSGRPFHDKPGFYLTHQSFKATENGFFLSRLADREVLIRKQNGIVSTLTLTNNVYVYENENAEAIFDASTFKLREAKFLNSDTDTAEFHEAAAMRVLMDASRGLYIENNLW
jgi:putative selenate reductase